MGIFARCFLYLLRQDPTATLSSLFLPPTLFDSSPRDRQALCDEREPAAWQMVVPPARLCTDNGVMVAWAAVERLREGMSNDAEGQEVYARLPLGRSAGAEQDAAAIASMAF